MNELLSFPRSESSRRVYHKIFVAVLPPRPISERMEETARDLKNWYQLEGRLRPTNHFHVTICEVGDFLELDEKIIAIAKRAVQAAAAMSPCFDFEVDQAVCFGKGLGNVPLVLARKERCKLMDQLHRNTFLQLRAHGLQIRKRSFNPHVTVSYNPCRIPADSIDPIGWHVGELVLIHSHVGLTKYTELIRCATGSPAV